MRNFKLLCGAVGMAAIVIGCAPKPSDVNSSYEGTWIEQRSVYISGGETVDSSVYLSDSTSPELLQMTRDSLVMYEWSGQITSRTAYSYQRVFGNKIVVNENGMPDTVPVTIVGGQLVLGLAETGAHYVLYFNAYNNGTVPPQGWPLMLADDSYEPDNTPATASTIVANGSTQAHTLTAGDVDYVKFAATAGTSYTIQASGTTTMYLYLYSTDGATYINYTYGTTPYISWTCTTSGTYYIRVSGYTSSYTGSYTLSLTSSASTGDSYEPDNTPATASTIVANGSSQAHTLTVADIDYVKFTATAGATYTISASGTTTMYLELYSTDGATYINYTYGTTPYLTWTCATSGTYYISVSGYTSSYTGSYTLSLTSTALVADSYEPDNTAATASTIVANGSSQAHTLTAGDLDFAKFAATAGTTYTIQASGNTTMYLYLYSTDGATYINYTYGTTPYISWTCTTSGTYYIRVSGYTSSYTGSYTLSLTSVAGDSYEPDNTAATASTIVANGSSQAHTLTTADIDYVKFAATAGTTYTIQASGTTTMYLELYSTDGATYINYTYGTTPYITWTCTTSGTYYISVSGYTSSYTGSYTLSLTSTAAAGDSYEPDNTAATASTIVVNGSSQAHTLTTADIDYVKFAATAGTTYTIAASGTTTMYLELYSTDGATYINYTYGTTPYLTWTCTTSGTYYISVSGYTSSYTGSYTLSVTSQTIAADSYEPDNTPSLASTIVANGAAQSHTLTAGDIDYVKFAATAGHTYTIQTSGGTGDGTDTYLLLYSTDGVTLLTYDDDISGTDLNSLITWTCPSSGTYYFAVRGYSSTTIGNYSVSVTSN